jgi:hypothetical protein
MKTISKLFVLTFLLIICASTMQAQVSATSTTEATIIAPISIDKDIDLNFGNLAVGGLGGVVTLAPDVLATRTQVGGVTFPAVTGPFTAAIFTVGGLMDQTYSIAISPASLLITRQSGTETMLVNNFTSTPSPTGQLNGSGAETIYVGADLTVAALQAAGVYVSGANDFTVTVNYN